MWPAVWTLGNLGRAGYGATLDGLWPYTYDTCDVGTAPNQTHNGLPEAATVDGTSTADFALSYLPGQRLSRWWFFLYRSSCVMLNHLKDVRAPEKATQDLFTHRMVAMWDEVHPRLTCSKLRCVFVIVIPWLQSWTNSLLIYVGYWRSINGSSVSIGSVVRSFFAFKISDVNCFQW